MSDWNKPTSKEIREQVESIIKADGCEHWYYGVRAQEVPFKLGQKIRHHSRVWNDGYMTSKRLPGLCALNHFWLDRINIETYPCEYIAVIAGDELADGELCEDPGEIIIKDPVVIGIIR